MLPAIVTALLCAAPAAAAPRPAPPPDVARLLAHGELLDAWRVVHERTDWQGRYLTCALVPRCSWQYGLRPLMLDVDHGYARMPPLPTIPPANAATIGRAYVNVASARVRTEATPSAPTPRALQIGDTVRIDRFDGSYAHLVDGGFVLREQLSAEKPNLDGLLEAARAVAASDTDRELVLLWRAFNLAPQRTDVLERLISEALRVDRTPLAVEAVETALARDTWALAKDRPKTINELQNHLYRAAMAKRLDLIVRASATATNTEDLGPKGHVTVAAFLPQYFALQEDGAIFQLTEGLTAATVKGNVLEKPCGEAQLRIEQTPHGPRIDRLHLEPATCDWELLRGERSADQPCRALAALNPGVADDEPAHAASAPEAPPDDYEPEPEPLPPPAHPATVVVVPAPATPPTVDTVIAYYDYDTNAGIYVKRWVNGGWESIGAPRGRGQDAIIPKLALTSRGLPGVLFASKNGLLFEQWNGQSWQPAGASTEPGGLAAIAGKRVRAYQYSLAFDVEDRPVVVFNAFDDFCLKVMRFERTGWRSLDCAAPQGFSPTVLIDVDGEPTVVFENGSNGVTPNRVFARHHTANGWVDLPGVEKGFAGSDHAGPPTAGSAPDRTPVVLWPVCDAVVAKGAHLVGGRWEYFGSGHSTCDGGGAFPMTVDSNGHPIVVHLGPGPGGPFPVRVERFYGGRWEEFGHIEGRASRASIAPEADGFVLAWSSVDALHVVRWDGNAWTPVDSPAGSGRWSDPVVATTLVP